MRVTNNQLTKKQADWVKITTKEKHEAVNPETKKPVSVDFSKDLFSLLDTLTPHKSLKNLPQIDTEVADGYIRRELSDYLPVREHYTAIRRFLSEFTYTRLYQHLQSLNNPEKALELLLQMFSPPPPPSKGSKKPSQDSLNNDNQQNQDQDNSQSQQSDDQQNQQNQQSGNQPPQEQENKQDKKESQPDKNETPQSQPNQQKGGSGQSKQNQNDQPQSSEKQESDKTSQKSQGQNSQEDSQEEMDNSQEEELSNDPPPPLLDLEKFKQDMPSIEEALKKNIFDDDIERKLMEQQSGTGHNALTTMEGLTKNIDKVARYVKRSNFKILDAARKFSVTEQYTREENLSDVPFPEKDWRVTNLKTMSDLPKVLPHQFLYPDEVFDKMLIDKDLKVKQHQSRKKKKQVLYILIDGSGSMNKLRQMTASAIAIAYIRKAIEEKSIYFYRHFDDTVFPLHTVTNEEEAIKEIGYLMNNPQSDGGTSIDKALKTAIEDINNPKLFKQDKKDKSELYERADILIITDGEDSVHITKEFLEEKKIVLHSFLLSGINNTLKEISHTYQHFQENKMQKIIN